MLNPWRVAESHEDLFVQRYNRLVGMSLQLTGHDREQAEDLVHEAFVEFTLGRPDLDAIQNLEGYLYGMLRNLHLSQVRRAARRHTQSLSLLDYDSAEIGLRSSDPRDRIRAKDELRDVCSYACLRKETSKAGSVLLLRFFHGYYPVEIAQVLRSPRRAVDDWLRIARREAKLYLENPRRLNPIRLSLAADALQIATGQMAGDYLSELRTAIFRSCKGSCLSLDRLRELYLSAETDSIDNELLGHIVSCARCLDEVNHLLGLPPLAGRFPNDMIGPDSHSHGGTGKSGSGSAGKPVKSLTRRAKEVFEHSPRELRISVNGFILGSQRIGAEVSEQTLNVNAGEKIGFVEVFSEQEIRLAFMNVQAPPDGPVRQRAAIPLSEGRTIELAVSFSDPWPTVHALYQDPAAVRALDTGEATAAVRDLPASARRASLLSDWWRRIAASGILLRPASITAALVILLIGILTFFRVPSRPAFAAELLRRAGALEEVARADSNFVIHRALSLEERVPGSG
ncbi:MAG TPA: sigma-70 family RNA polymerase sigma factor, partial [Blastocatellia bacterium]|nr:sigma-70 family RNA polymerase sigma factor [Blastocatellia bacterium]